MIFSFLLPIKYTEETLSFLNKNDYKINENESDIFLGFFTLDVSQDEIPYIQDFIQEVQQ